MTALKNIQSGQASMLQELKAIQQKLSQNDDSIREMNNRLTKVEKDCESVLAIKTQLDNISKLSDQNAQDVTCA